MRILSERSANQNYGAIISIHNNSNHSSIEKTPKLWTILEAIFIEMTSQDVAFGTPILERMKILFDEKNSVPKDIIDASHKTRMLCNAIRHKGHEANDIDYVGAVEAIAKCMQYFSEVPIPPEVECIFNLNVVAPIIKQATPLQPKAPQPKLTIRQKDLIDNPAARLPVALLLDTSGSMLYDNRIGELNKGIDLFFNSIIEDEVTRYSVELAIITFGKVVTKILDFANIERQLSEFQQNMPLSVNSPMDGTPMGEAVELAIKILNERKEEYKTAGVEYYQPWLVLMTDGQPTDSISNSTILTESMIQADKLSLFPIAIGAGANLIELGKFSSKRPPLRLKGLNFREFFEWLKESAKNTSQSTPGQSTSTPPIGWAVL